MTGGGTGVRAYRDLLGEPALRRVAVGALTARLPTSMWSVVLFLLVTSRRDASAAAVVVAVYTLGQAATAPVRGRWVDRRGIRGVIPLTTTAHLIAVAVLVLTVGRVPLAVTAVAAALAGSLFPPVVAVVRGLWLAVTPPGPPRQTAMALDAVLLEVAFIVGPAVAGLLAVATDPLWAVLPVAALLVVAAVEVLRADPGHQPVPGGARSVWGPLARPGFTLTVVLALAPTTAVAGIEVLLLTISQTGGYAWAGGMLLALMSVGSLIGGLLFGAYGAHRSAVRWFPLLLVVMALSLPLLLLGQGVPWTFVLVAPLVGATTAPALATVFSLSAAAAPAGARTEAQSWVNTSITGGFALGAFLVAPLTERIPLAVVAFAAIAGAGALAAVLARGLLTEPAESG